MSIIKDGILIITVNGIDVDWNRTQSSRDQLASSGICKGCSLPMHNIVGAFSQDPLQAATFALHLLTFNAAAVMAVYVYSTSGRRSGGGSSQTQWFGLRAALVLFTMYEPSPHLPYSHLANQTLDRASLPGSTPLSPPPRQ